MLGSKAPVNEDFALVNQEQGIHVICDASNKAGKGNYASEFVARQIQERLVHANREMRDQEISYQGPKRLQKMQESVLSAFNEVGADFLKLGTQNSNFAESLVSCIAVWVNDRFAILAHLGTCRAYLYRSGKIFTLTKDHVALEGNSEVPRVISRAFGPNLGTPDLLKIEFEPNDILFLATDGLYEGFDKNGILRMVEMMLNGENLKPLLSQCAYSSGDHATLVQIQFPAESTGSVLSASERIQLVSRTPLCRYMNYAEQSHMAALCQIEEFDAGTILVQEGTEGECMYLIAKGTLEVNVRGQFIVYKKAGEFLGEVSLIQQGKRTATAIAKDRVTLLSLQRSDLREAFKKDIELEKNFYRGMLEMVLDRLVEQGREIARMKSV
ncbi:MAG: cyclic nucleotide-binding domain-containing protein [Bdellovibrionales bacterium]|nr:cyclic nucleotide-binding domain-containing protein [Bdellovibrionales bacterium]